MLAGYGYLGLFIVIAILFPITTIILPVFLRFIRIVPRKPNPVKTAPFECGMETIGKAWVQFNSRYYFYALIFVALDVMVLFLYPWAIGLRQLGASGLIAIAVFVLIIVVGYVYAWKKKALEWK